jgi:hypothetical protein
MILTKSCKYNDAKTVQYQEIMVLLKRNIKEKFKLLHHKLLQNTLNMLVMHFQKCRKNEKL